MCRFRFPAPVPITWIANCPPFAPMLKYVGSVPGFPATAPRIVGLRIELA